MLYLKQSTGSQTVLIGPFLDSEDFVSVEDGLTIDASDIRLSKNGGNIAGKNSGGATHDENGWYQITLDATDTDTVGTLQLHVDVAGALPVWHDFTVLEEDIYDALIGSGAAAFDANARVDVAQIEGSDATDQIRDAVVDDATRIDASQLNTLSGNDPGSQLAAQSDITALNDLSAADVNSEVDTALSDIHLDHLLATDYDPSSPPGTGTALLNELVENDGGVSRFTANALEEAPTGGSAPTASEIADAVWDEDITTHTDPDSAGEEIQAHALSSEISALNDFDPNSDTVTVDTNNDKTGYELDGTINTLDDLMLDVGTAQDGSSNSITLRSGASSTDDLYVGSWVFIISGTGAGQSALIVGYTGSTKEAGIRHSESSGSGDWATTPDNTSVYAIFPASRVDLGTWKGLEPNDLVNFTRVPADVGSISEDAGAANNLEALLDGTGGVTLSADLDGTINGLTAAALADFFDTDSGTDYSSAVAGSVVKETADNAGGSSLSPGDIADAVWDEDITEHTTADSAGEALGDAGSGASASTIADAVWDEDRADHTTVGTFGEGVNVENLNTQAKADVNAEADTALSDYDPPTKAELDSGLAGLNDLSANEVNAEVDTALSDYDGPTKAELDSGFAALNDFDPDTEDVTVGTNNDKTGYSLADDAIDDDVLASDLDVYDARAWVLDDNSANQDVWIVVFYKNGAPSNSGISSPTITVVDASDGSDLIDGAALSQVGSTKFYRRTESSDRIEPGKAYGVEIDWTQDGSSRSSATVTGRDATAS